MTQRGAVILAAALTAFVLVVAGGVAGRLSRPERPAASAPAAAAPRQVVAARAVEHRAVAPRPAVWREHEHEHEHDEHEDDDD